MHRADRLHGLHPILPRQERGIEHGFQLRQRSAPITIRPTGTLRKTNSVFRTRVLVCALTATSRVRTLSATTNSTSTARAERLTSSFQTAPLSPRLRLFWVDVRKGKIEFLAGQSWSMLVPNRTGISALPGDLFYSQVIDINYVAGLTWTRQPGARILYHPSDKVTFSASPSNRAISTPAWFRRRGHNHPADRSRGPSQHTQIDTGGNISLVGLYAIPVYTRTSSSRPLSTPLRVFTSTLPGSRATTR